MSEKMKKKKRKKARYLKLTTIVHGKENHAWNNKKSRSGVSVLADAGEAGRIPVCQAQPWKLWWLMFGSEIAASRWEKEATRTTVILEIYLCTHTAWPSRKHPALCRELGLAMHQ